MYISAGEAPEGASVWFVFRYRPAPIDAAVLLWLAIYAFSPKFDYLVWRLPFFIMAGPSGWSLDFALAVRIVRQHETNPSGIQPPLVRLAPSG